MTGACKAAIVDKTRFIRIKGYGSNLFADENVLNRIQATRIAEKEMIKFQLPPNLATLSDMLWPLVIISFGSFKRFSTTSFSSSMDF